MPQCREQRSTEAAVGRRSASSMISRIAPPRSAKSKSSTRSSTRSVAVGGSEQAKKGERLSNYNKGPMPPPSPSRPIQSPPPAEMAMTAFGGWVGGGVSQPPLDGYPCGLGLTPVMHTLVEEPDEALSMADQPREKMNSPKQRPKLLPPLKLNSPTLRPRTQSAGTSRSAGGSDLRLSADGCSSSRVPSSPHRTTSPLTTNSAGFLSSSDCNSPATPNSANGRLPGSPLGVRIPKLIRPTDNDTSIYLFQFYRSGQCKPLLKRGTLARNTVKHFFDVAFHLIGFIQNAAETLQVYLLQ